MRAEDTEPNRDLVIAVSRRFRTREIDTLYKTHIEPLLARQGIVLICDFASNDVAELDYWMNRMNIILDLADVHVILDLDRSPNTFYEFESSNLGARSGSGFSLKWNFGISACFLTKPYRIIVHDQRWRYCANSLSYARLGLHSFARAKVVRLNRRKPADMESNLSRALQASIEIITKERRKTVDIEQGGGSILKYVMMRGYEEDALALPASNIWQIKSAVARRMAFGRTPADIRDEMFKLTEAKGDEREIQQMRDVKRQIESHSKDILSFNEVIQRFAELSDKVIIDGPQFKHIYQFTKYYFDFFVISESARHGISASVFQEDSINEILQHPVIKQLKNCYCLLWAAVFKLKLIWPFKYWM